jgi:LuxR family maltose regulon positive regulatory protein
LERASHLVQQLSVTWDGIQDKADIPYSRIPEYLLLVRLLLAQCEYDSACSLSERLLGMAEAAKRISSVIEILVLQALAWQGKKDMTRAVAVLEKALSLAQPEGYTRVFLDEGEPLAKLLYQVKSRRMGQGYATELLSEMGGIIDSEARTATVLIEPLTQRELEVLKLIESGYTNQEIAGRLFISIPTVKRHLSNIFSKLGAKSRTQAVSLSRELGFFE